MTRVAIFDYGAGNIFSLKNSLEREGADAVEVITDFDARVRYDGLLLPGVGNFDPAMRAISRNGFADYVGEEMQVLGICLGMEIFFAKSEEGRERGLDVINGTITALPSTMKVPHMGWNRLDIRRPGRLLEGVKDGSWVYFVHSYMARPAVQGDGIITAKSDYNGIAIPATVEYKNLMGTQFHPEKSGVVGRRMVRNFLEACRR